MRFSGMGLSIALPIVTGWTPAVSGPDLTQVWASGRSDGAVPHLRRGAWNRMPSVGPRTDDEVWKILAYLKTLPRRRSRRGSGMQNGERVRGSAPAATAWTAPAGACPDLANRRRACAWRRVRGATEDFLDGHQPVITLKNGQTVRGVRKNGDLFSVQIMDGRERIQGYLERCSRGHDASFGHAGVRRRSPH
jgi:hypothetical protein